MEYVFWNILLRDGIKMEARVLPHLSAVPSAAKADTGVQ
jgi:hypothetical protein